MDKKYRIILVTNPTDDRIEYIPQVFFNNRWIKVTSFDKDLVYRRYLTEESALDKLLLFHKNMSRSIHEIVVSEYSVDDLNNILKDKDGSGKVQDN